MSEVIGEGVIRIRTDESGVDTSASGRAAGEGYTKGFIGSLGRIAVAVGGVLAARKVLDFTKASIGEAREAQKVGAATEQIIKATGGAARVSAKDVADLAAAQSLKTGVDDELIQSGQNLILTFKNVKNAGTGTDAIFDRTTKAALDLSAAGFGSVSSASLQLGKALNDPIKGIAALSRSGVTFTETQKAQIKTLVEQGDLLGAQKVILGEVEGQVGGVAAATATAGEKASTAWANVKEEVGTRLLPVLDRLERFFVASIVPAIFTMLDATEQIGPVFSRVKGFIEDLLGGSSGQQAAGFFDQVRDAVEALVPVLLDGFVNTVLPAVLGFFGELRSNAEVVLPLIQDLIVGKVLPAVLGLGDYLITNLVPIFVQLAHIVTTDVLPIIATLATFLYGTLYPTVVDIVTVVATKLKPVFDQLVTTIRTSILPTVDKMITQIREQLLPVLLPIVERLVKVIGVLLKFAAIILAKVLPPVIRLIGFLLEHLIPVLVTLVTWIVKVVGWILDLGDALVKGVKWLWDFYQGVLTLEKKGLQGLLDAITSLPGRIRGLAGKMLDAGKHIISAFLRGLGKAGGFVAGFADKIWEAVKSVINAGIDKLNELLDFDISVPGPDIHVSAPDIGHLASGTSNWRGGVTWVGEQGPELLNLPRGSQVLPAAQSAALAGGSGVQFTGPIHVEAHDYNDFQAQMLRKAHAASMGGRRLVSA